MTSAKPSLLDLSLLAVVFAVGFTGLKDCSDAIRNAWSSFNVEDSTAIYKSFQLFEAFRWGTIVFVAPLTLATALRQRLPSRGSGEVPSKGTMLCLAATLRA